MELRTPNTITHVDRLIVELSRIRRNGYSLDDEELLVGVRSVAAPIFNHSNVAVGAISISALQQRMPDEIIHEAHLPSLLDTARKISNKLGFSKTSINRF